MAAADEAAGAGGLVGVGGEDGLHGLGQLCYSDRRADQAAGTRELSNEFETRRGAR
jgi:hypothetical protein